ncbi:MAG: MFS transporter [Oscillospiraceae bacterium]|nr:MFS transporter [Oscillospiraceae bacterium]MDD6146712.1 MFS transporter [Oscillospiraceae bacterium]
MNTEKPIARTDVTEKRYVGVKETLVYGIANGGQCIGYNMVRGQLTFFLVTVMGVPAPVVTAMIFFMGIWDAFNDPLMGTVVDRTRTRFGKLRPYLIFVPIPLGITTVLFFGGAEFLKSVESTTLKIVYMCITYFLWEFMYTIGDIPFWGLSAAISPNPADRSRVIKSARFLSGIIGGIPGIIISLGIDLTKSGMIPITLSQLFLILGILGGTVGMGLFSLSGIFTKERIVHVNDEPKLSDCFRYMFKNKYLLLIVIASVLGTFEGVADAFTQYYYALSLGIASLSLVAGIPGTIAGWFTYGFMGKLEKRWSSKQIVVAMSFLKFAVTGTTFLIGIRHYTDPKVIVPLLAIQGIFTSFIGSIRMVIPTKMIGETVDYMEWKTGERNEGTAFSLLTFIAKLTGSLTTAIATAIIPLIGLQEVGQDMMLAENSTVNTRFWLWALVTILPNAFGLLSNIPYIFYDLDNRKIAEINAELAKRRGEIAQIKEEG